MIFVLEGCTKDCISGGEFCTSGKADPGLVIQQWLPCPAIHVFPKGNLLFIFYQFEAFPWDQHSYLWIFAFLGGGPGRLVWCNQWGEVKKTDLIFAPLMVFSRKKPTYETS